MEPISFLVWLIVIIVLLGVLWWGLSISPFPAQIRIAIMIIVSLLVFLYFIQKFGLP